MKNFIKIVIASSLVFGVTAMASGATAFGGGGASKAPSNSTVIASGATAFGGGGNG